MKDLYLVKGEIITVSEEDGGNSNWRSKRELYS